MIDITPKSIMEYADVFTKLQIDIPAKAAGITAYRKNKEQVDDMIEHYDKDGINSVLEMDDSMSICKDYLEDYLGYREYYEQMLNVQAMLGLIGVGSVLLFIGKGVWKVVKIFK